VTLRTSELAEVEIFKHNRRKPAQGGDVDAVLLGVGHSVDDLAGSALIRLAVSISGKKHDST
jgi:hypothetical protein